MTLQRKKLGKEGEGRAIKTLLKLGYEIIQKNYKNKIGEIDIVSKDKNTWCFVEVKTKTGSGYGSPEEMVGRRKQQKIIKTAELYLLEHKLKNPNWRIDVVAVDIETDEIRVIKNAVWG